LKKNIAIALGAFSIAGLALAPLASADPAPAPAPGTYTFVTSKQSSLETVAQDCGPSCWSMTETAGRIELRLVGDRWQADNGIWTVDNVNFTNQYGKTATLTPA
jgi:hypothetical protein